MTPRPTSIRNIPWAAVLDGTSRRHVHRRDIDLFLKGGRVAEITPAGARPPKANEAALDGRGMLALPGLVNIHSHPSTEPGYRGVREDHGVPKQQMTGLTERLQAFRLGDDGLRRHIPLRRLAGDDGERRHALPCGADLRLGALGHRLAADGDLEMG